jgi:hypothetical protein
METANMSDLKHLGPLGALSLWAECCLWKVEKGELSVSDEEREELDRIASAPKLEDRVFLVSLEVTDQQIDKKEQELQELKKGRDVREARRKFV